MDPIWTKKGSRLSQKNTGRNYTPGDINTPHCADFTPPRLPSFQLAPTRSFANMSGNTYPDPPLLCETGTPILPNNPLYLVIFPNPTTIPRLALWNDGSHEPKEKLELRRLEDVEGQRVTHRLDSASRIVLKIIHPGHPTFGNIEDRNLHSDHAPGFDDPGCGHWSGLAVVQVSTGSVKLVSVDYDGHNDEAVRKNRFMQRRKNDEGADQVIFGPELTQTTTDDQWLLEDFDIAIANRG